MLKPASKGVAWLCECLMVKKWNSKLHGQMLAEVPFVGSMGVAEQNDSCIGAFDVEPLKYHCSTGVVVADGEARGVQTVLVGGSGISIIIEAGLHRLPHPPR